MNDGLLSPELVFSSRLADPIARRQLELDNQVNWSEVLSILRNNKIPLLPLVQDTTIGDCPLIRQPDFQKAAKYEEESWKSLRYEYSLVRDGFLKHGISNVLFKSVGLPPSFPYTSDNVDVLVPSTEIKTARRVLNELGYVELRHIEEPMKFLFKKYLAAECVSAIHLHGFVGWGGRFMDDDALWRGCRPSPDDPLVIIPSPEDAALVTIAHAFYENKCYKLLDILRIRYCFNHGPLDYAYMQRVAKGRSWENGLAFSLLVCAHLEKLLFGETLIPKDIQAAAYQRISKSSWLRQSLERTIGRNEIHFPYKLSFLFVKFDYYRKILSDPQRALGRRLYSLVATLAAGIKLKLHIRGQRGRLISLSGIDGSGKTSTSQALIKAFTNCDILAYPLWVRFGSIPWSKKIKRLSQNSKHFSSTINAPTKLEKRKSRLNNPIARIGWTLVNLAYLLFLYNLAVRIRTWLGTVIVCDRYVYDALAEIEVSLPSGSSLNHISEWILIHLCPKPDISWYLDTTPEEALSRQNEEQSGVVAQQELEHQREIYQVLQDRYHMILVSNHGDKDQTISLIILKTLQIYFEDYHTWINGLLFSNPSQMNRERRQV